MTSRQEPKWIRADIFVMAVHHSLMDHGGMSGTVKEDLLESALHKPRHLWHYEGVDELAVLAAAYATGISRDHPFTDGNKRAAFLAIGLFLKLNHCRLKADRMEAIHIIMGLAQNELDQTLLAAWITQNIEYLKAE